MREEDVEVFNVEDSDVDGCVRGDDLPSSFRDEIFSLFDAFYDDVNTQTARKPFIFCKKICMIFGDFSGLPRTVLQLY